MLVAGAAVALVALAAGPAGPAGPAGARSGSPAAPGDRGGSRVEVSAVPASDAPPRVLVTAHRYQPQVHGDRRGTVGGSYVQMPCQSYAHPGWTERAWNMTAPNGVTHRAHTVESHDRDAAGRCLTCTGHGVQARMLQCGYLDTYRFENRASSGWHQLESLQTWYCGPLVTGNPADRNCLDVHVNPSQTTNVVHHRTCGPLDEGNQLLRVQTAWP